MNKITIKVIDGVSVQLIPESRLLLAGCVVAVALAVP